MDSKSCSLLIVVVLIISLLCACGTADNRVSEPSVASNASVPAITESETVDSKPVEGESRDQISSTEMSTTETTESTVIANEPLQSDKEKNRIVMNDDGTVNYLYYYSSILSRVHYVMTYPSDDFEYEEGENWLFEISHYASGHNNLQNYGYCLKDISGDGVPELILTDRIGKTVYNLYTLVDYKPYLIFEGWTRSRYGYLGGNSFAWFASAGAMYQMLGTYNLSENGKELIPIDYYFTSEGDSVSEVVSYHNTMGEPDKENSEIIDNDVFLTAWNELEEQITSLDMVPYSFNTIEIAYENEQQNKQIVGRYVTDTTEYAQTVVIYDNNGMYDVELLGLDFIDFTDMGNMVFDIRYIYNMGETTGEQAIAVTITFGEIAPHFGVQYKDANGVCRKFAIDVSGEDGSVYLWEF